MTHKIDWEAHGPKLLEALERVVEQLSHPGNATHSFGAFCYGASMADARAAIAAAKGETGRE